MVYPLCAEFVPALVVEGGTLHRLLLADPLEATTLTDEDRGELGGLQVSLGEGVGVAKEVVADTL